jgi:biopolymer transport protein ExbD
MADEDQIEIRKGRRNKEDAELDMTAMIDVTFLLLAFFVVVSKMDPQKTVDLPIASVSFNVPEKNCVVLVATADSDTETFKLYKGSTMLEQDQISLQDPDLLEDEVGAYVEEQFSQHPTKEAVLIKGEGDVRTGLIEMVKRGINLSELARSRKIHIAVEEK